jgi:hypothetical protein
MFLLRVLKNAYELFDATDVVRLAKSSNRSANALGFASRMIGGDGAPVIDSPVFVGSAFEPNVDGASNVVTLGAGIAFLYDSSEADVWLGEVEAILADSEDSIAMATNTDGSGDDRIDVISLRPLELEEDDQLRWFKDPVTLTPYQKTSPQRVRVDYEIVVTTGVVDPAPVAPATPAGTYKVAEVIRVNGQANVLSVDLTDSRALDRVRAGYVESFSAMAARLGALYFGDPDGDHYRMERDSDTAPTHLRIRNQVGADVDLEVGELWATRYMQSNNVRARVDSGDLLEGIVNVYNDDGTKYGMMLSANTSIAWGSFIHTGGILVAQDHFGMGGTSTKIATGRYKIEFDSGVWGLVITNAGAVQATCNELSTGAATPLIVMASLSTDGAAYGGGGGTVVEVEFYNFAGVLTDPTATFELSLTCSILPVP